MEKKEKMAEQMNKDYEQWCKDKGLIATSAGAVMKYMGVKE